MTRLISMKITIEALPRKRSSRHSIRNEKSEYTLMASAQLVLVIERRRAISERVKPEKNKHDNENGIEHDVSPKE